MVLLTVVTVIMVAVVVVVVVVVVLVVLVVVVVVVLQYTMQKFRVTQRDTIASKPMTFPFSGPLRCPVALYCPIFEGV